MGVEYLQSSGTQYINTGIVPNTNFIVDVDFEVLSLVSNDDVLCGVISPNIHIGYTSTNAIDASFKDGTGHNVSVTTTVLNTRHRAQLNKNTFTLDGTAHSFTQTAFLSFTRFFFIFAGSYATPGSTNDPYGYVNARIYNFTIYDGAKFYTYEPAKRKVDGVLGLYDTTNNQFYTNAGTGVFIAGAEQDFIAGTETTT